MQKLDAVTKNEQKPHDGDNNGPERPTYVKVHRKHLLPATLDAYQLPWEWDSVGWPCLYAYHIMTADRSLAKR